MAVTNYDLECCNEIGEPVSRPGCTANKYDKAPSTLQTDLYGNVSPNFFPQIQIRISEESDIIFTLVFLAECFIKVLDRRHCLSCALYISNIPACIPCATITSPANHNLSRSSLLVSLMHQRLTSRIRGAGLISSLSSQACTRLSRVGCQVCAKRRFAAQLFQINTLYSCARPLNLCSSSRGCSF